MHSRKRLQDDLEFVGEFSALFEVMQQVAVSQLRQAQEQSAGRVSLIELMRREVLPGVPEACRAHPLLRGGPAGRLIVVFTSDQGFVGPLHSGVIREARRLDGPQSRWLLVGQRGARMLSRSVGADEVLSMPSEETMERAMQRLGERILARYLRERLREVWMVAPRFLSATHQDVVTLQVLPLPVGSKQGEADEGVLLEPSAPRALEALASAWLACACVETCWSARQAEFAARAMHVEESRQGLAKQAQAIHYEWFKTMHARMDVLVRETCVVQREMARRG